MHFSKEVGFIEYLSIAVKHTQAFCKAKGMNYNGNIPSQKEGVDPRAILDQVFTRDTRTAS